MSGNTHATPTCPRCHRSGPGIRFRLDFADPANPNNACEDCEKVSAVEGSKAKATLVRALSLVLEEGADR